MKKEEGSHDKDTAAKRAFPGYPHYPEQEDIYNQELRLRLEENEASLIEKGLANDSPAADLDIPGTELDDGNESIGEEDEENNYYSLGGDRHEDLEEHEE